MKLSMAEPLKNMVMELFDLKRSNCWGSQSDKAEPIDHLERINPELPWTGRRLLEFIGTDVMRNIYPDIWVSAVERRLWSLGLGDSGSPVIPAAICDLRFENEAHMVRRLGGVVIRVSVPGEESGTEHISGQWFKDANVDGEVIARRGDIEGLKAQLMNVLRGM